MLNIHGITIHSYIKEKRKTISIKITPKGEITLKAPLRIADAEAYGFIERKKNWIQKKLAHFAQFEPIIEASITSGQNFLYLGQQYILTIKENKSSECIEINNNTLIIHTKKLENERHNKRLMDRWLLRQAERIFHERLSLALQSFPSLARPVLKIRKYKGRWGSYASNHVMALNSLLIHAPQVAIDYVIIHELCHYYHKKHDAKFYALLADKMPQWKEAKNNLNQDSCTIN